VKAKDFVRYTVVCAYVLFALASCDTRPESSPSQPTITTASSAPVSADSVTLPRAESTSSSVLGSVDSTSAPLVAAQPTPEDTAVPNPVLLTLVEGPHGSSGLIVLSATNRTSESYPTSFAMRLDALSAAGEWNALHDYTAASPQYPGGLFDPAKPVPSIQRHIDAGETKPDLTLALGQLPSGRYRIRMQYDVKVPYYNTVTPEWSSPVIFSIEQ
jgi:hypothetical protein